MAQDFAGQLTGDEVRGATALWLQCAKENNLFNVGSSQGIPQVLRRLALLFDKIIAIAHAVDQVVNGIDLP
ncbi:hypothetical protein D3C81_1864150 [compost metagenome]